MSARPDEFARLIATHMREIYRYVLTLVPSPADAEDVIQETSIKLWSQFDKFDPNTNFAAWAFRIAYYEVLTHRTKHRRDRHLFSSELVEKLAERRAAMSESLIDRRRLLEACLEELSEPHRQLLRDRYAGTETMQALAQRTGRPINTIYKTLDRIRRALGACVDRKAAEQTA
ncbi:MAG: sigma-70 family RNA polymerase sigma factor [Planctomycetes bacterium]|nr:sigma-70 family RNA polymerase sigma factor [Planctomycetota bacterium]